MTSGTFWYSSTLIPVLPLACRQINSYSVLWEFSLPFLNEGSIHFGSLPKKEKSESMDLKCHLFCFLEKNHVETQVCCLQSVVPSENLLVKEVVRFRLTEHSAPYC